MQRTSFAAVSLIAFASLWALACGGMSLQQDPTKTVTLEITGVSNEEDRKDIQEVLKGMTDGSSHSMSTTWSGDKFTVNLSPVSDIDSFAKKIDFGEVTTVDGRTVKVTVKE